jgi:ribosome-associated heat shock protein Hsp15
VGNHGDPAGVRIDKWLWAARFFKTRSLARDAIDGGMVRVDGARAKPARLLKGGETLEVRKGPFLQVVVVEGLSDRRGDAERARTLYRETEESLLEREKTAAELRALRPVDGGPGVLGRPTKRDRRRIERFTGRNSG